MFAVPPTLQGVVLPLTLWLKAHTCILSKVSIRRVQFRRRMLTFGLQDVTTPDGWRIEIDVRSDPAPGSYLLFFCFCFRFWYSALRLSSVSCRSARSLFRAQLGVAPRVVVSHIRKEQSLSHEPHEQFVFTYRFARCFLLRRSMPRARNNLKRKRLGTRRLRFLVHGATLEACDARFVGVGDEWSVANLAPQVKATLEVNSFGFLFHFFLL